MKKQTVKLASIALLSSLFIPLVSVKADIQTDTINEMWGKPTLVYGAGLTNSEVNQTNTVFGIKNIGNVNRQVNSGQDFQTYLGQSGVADNSLFSSVLVQKQGKGKGVQVDIKTPQNITQVTETQYANAAITAGASDVQIDKALSANGVKVDSDRTAVANQELETVNDIANAQKNNKDFDSKALDLANAQIKSDLAEYKKKNGETADTNQVEAIINKALKDNNLDGVLTNDQVDSLVNFAKTYQNTDAIDSQEVANQLNKYTKDTYNKLSDKFKNAVNSDEARGAFDSIKTFFNNVWKSITNFFNRG